MTHVTRDASHVSRRYVCVSDTTRPHVWGSHVSRRCEEHDSFVCPESHISHRYVCVRDTTQRGISTNRISSRECVRHDTFACVKSVIHWVRDLDCSRDMTRCLRLRERHDASSNVKNRVSHCDVRHDIFAFFEESSFAHRYVCVRDEESSLTYIYVRERHEPPHGWRVMSRIGV